MDPTISSEWKIEILNDSACRIVDYIGDNTVETLFIPDRINGYEVISASNACLAGTNPSTLSLPSAEIIPSYFSQDLWRFFMSNHNSFSNQRVFSELGLIMENLEIRGGEVLPVSSLGSLMLKSLYLPNTIRSFSEDNSRYDKSGFLSSDIKAFYYDGSFAEWFEIEDVYIPNIEHFYVKSDNIWEEICDIVTIPDNVETISAQIAKIVEIKKIIVSDNVKTIKSDALYGLTNLEEVVIGNGVDTLPMGLLCERTNMLSKLRYVKLPFFGLSRNITKKSDGFEMLLFYDTFYYHGGFERSVPYYGPDTLEEIEIYGGDAVPNAAFSDFKHENLKITLPNTVKTIEESAFANVELDSLSLPASVEVISQNAFSGAKIITMSMTYEPKRFGENAFSNCEIKHFYFKKIRTEKEREQGLGNYNNLTEFVDAWLKMEFDHQYHPNNNDYLSCRANPMAVSEEFLILNAEGYLYIEPSELYLPSYVKRLPMGQFMNMKKVKTLKIEEGVETIEAGNYMNFDSLTTVLFLGNSQLKSLGSCFLNNCDSLERITLPSSVIRMETKILCDCENLKSIRWEPTDIASLDLPGQTSRIVGTSAGSVATIFNGNWNLEYIIAPIGPTQYLYSGHEKEDGSKELIIYSTGLSKTTSFYNRYGDGYFTVRAYAYSETKKDYCWHYNWRNEPVLWL